jgi:WD40 repeat protein
MNIDLPATLATSLHDPKGIVVIACGLGGGGAALAYAVIRELMKGSEPGDLVHEDFPDGCLYSWAGGQLIDLAVRSGLGRSRPSAKALPAGAQGTSVYLVRDRETAASIPAANIVDLTERPGESAALFRSLLRARVPVTDEAAEVITNKYGNATALIPELHALLQGMLRESGQVPMDADVLAACRRLPFVESLFQQVLGAADKMLMDLSRILILSQTHELECGDTWADLAFKVSGQPYTVGDISMCIFRYPGLFSAQWHDGRLMACPSSPMAMTLLEGHVAPAPSEHKRLYRVLRDIAVEEFVKGQKPPALVRRELPLQAVAGDAILELAADFLALAACDPEVLSSVLERDPDRLRPLGSRAAILCAHRLLTSQTGASHLELFGYRLGLDGPSRTLQERLPNRPWLTTWARAFSVNTNRVVLSRTSPTLAICTARHRPQEAPASLAGLLEEVFCGCSDGSVWRLSPYGVPRRVWCDQAHPAEIRAIAAVRTGSGILVGIGTSDHSVAVIDAASGHIVWRDQNAHADPVSAVTIAGTVDDPLLVSAGVSNQLWVHQMRAGRSSAKALHEHNSEIRGLTSVTTSAGEFVLFAAVDGAVGVVAMPSGRLIGLSRERVGVLNSVAAAVHQDELVIVAGSSAGEVINLRCTVDDLGSCGDPVALTVTRCIAKHDSAVNCVRLVIHHGRPAVISSSSDHTWRWTWLDSHHSKEVIGHIGPVWSVVAAEAPDGSLYAVTGGGEGDCRAWLVDVVLREKIGLGQIPRHRGGVTAIDITINDKNQMYIVTGDGEGEIRHWRESDPNADSWLAGHSGQVSAVICGYHPRDAGLLQVISGSLDGLLRLTHVPTGEPPVSHILGIAHEGVTALALVDVDHRQILISGGLDGTLTAWDLDGRRPRGTVSACRFGAVQSICATGVPSGQEFIVSGQDGSVSLWDTVSLSEIRKVRLDAAVLCVHPVPGWRNGWVAALTDGRIAVFPDFGRHAEEVRYINAHAGEVRVVTSFMLEGRLVVASGGLDRRLRLHDLDTGTRLLEIELEGYATGIVASAPFLGLSSSAGAVVFKLTASVFNVGVADDHPIL